MTMIKNSVIECFILLLCGVTVCLFYKLPNTINTSLSNTMLIVVMGICILRIALKIRIKTSIFGFFCLMLNTFCCRMYF